MSKGGVVLIMVLIIIGTFLYSRGYITNNTGSQSCNSNWACSNWSPCSDNLQTRTCKDTNNCGYYNNIPQTIKTCSDPGNGGSGGGGSTCVPQTEVCDGHDNNCNGLIDEGDVCTSTTTLPSGGGNGGGSTGSTGDGSSCTSSSNPYQWYCDSSFTSCSNNFKTKKCCQYQSAVGDTSANILTQYETLYCTQPVQPHGSTYGRIKVYLASSPATGYDLNKLKQISETWKSKIYDASYGIVDNLDFTLDPLNSDFSKPNIGVNTLLTQYNLAYYFSDHFPYEVLNMINFGIYSSAFPGVRVPWAWTGPIVGSSYNPDDPISSFWHDTLHEFAHTMNCAHDGDIMRPMPDLMDFAHYPPLCLEQIKKYMKEHAK